MFFECPTLFGNRLIIDEQRSAFAKRKRLVHVERNASDITDRSHVAVTKCDAHALCCIFHNPQTALGRERHDRHHVAGLPVDVHGKDGLGTLRQARFGRGVRDVEIERVHVDENRSGTAHQYRSHRAESRKVGNDHLVTRANAQHFERDEQRLGSVGDKYDILASKEAGKPIFQSARFGAFREHTLLERAEHLIDVFHFHAQSVIWYLHG